MEDNLPPEAKGPLWKDPPPIKAPIVETPEEKEKAKKNRQKDIQKIWILVAVMLAAACFLYFSGLKQSKVAEIIRQTAIGHFGIVWNNFDGQVRALHVVAKITLRSLGYEVVKSEYDSTDDVGLIWARYTHEPKKHYPPIVEIRVQKRTGGDVVLFFQGDKDYLSLRNQAKLPDPFAKTLYALIRTGKYNVKEKAQDDFSRYPLFPK